MKMKWKHTISLVIIGFLGYFFGRILLSLRNGTFSMDEVKTIVLSSPIPTLGFTLGVISVLYLKNKYRK